MFPSHKVERRRYEEAADVLAQAWASSIEVQVNLGDAETLLCEIIYS
jgi:hypothetical protein